MARIVVADDDVDIRDLVEFKLATLGHEIVTVCDGSAAVDACRAQPPDLAVLDIMMPGLTGLEAVREIRANPRLAGIPVILLTARAQQSDVETGFDSGADDYITKPFSPRDLATRVEALLSRTGRAQPLRSLGAAVRNVTAPPALSKVACWLRFTPRSTWRPGTR